MLLWEVTKIGEMRSTCLKNRRYCDLSFSIWSLDCVFVHNKPIRPELSKVEMFRTVHQCKWPFLRRRGKRGQCRKQECSILLTTNLLPNSFNRLVDSSKFNFSSGIVLLVRNQAGCFEELCLGLGRRLYLTLGKNLSISQLWEASGNFHCIMGLQHMEIWRQRHHIALP